MYNINQPVGVSDYIEQLGRRRCWTMHSLPLSPDIEGFFTPGAKGNGFNDGWCDDPKTLH